MVGETLVRLDFNTYPRPHWTFAYPRGGNISQE
ncbi:uncharacterized protein METZ01_LOCUS329214, partial [marine metagenome]